MPVLEICQLQVKPAISPTDPSILQSLVEVRSSLASKVEKTHSQFYQCVEDPTLIYIFGVWPSLSTHHAFLTSPQKPEILSPQQDLLDFNWMMHMDLHSMEYLPLDAHVMSVARLFVKSGESHAELQRMLDRQRHKIVDGTKPYKVVDGWRCDGEPGNHEALVFSGWKSTQAHEDFTVKAMADPEYASARDLCDGVEVRHMRNMEA